MSLLGIEIGGTKLQLCLGGADGQIRDRIRFEVNASEGGAGIRKRIEQTVAAIPRKFTAVGVGFGGPVDWKTGRIHCSHHIDGWDDFPLREWLAPLTGVPVFVDNDANVAALAEAAFGAASGLSPAFYVTLGSGVGGGLVVGGRIYHGSTPGEMEIGHVRLDKSGVILESRCSGWSVNGRVREAMAREPASALAQCAAEFVGAEAKALGPALARNDALAAKVIFDVADDLAFGLSHVTHLAHPQIVVIGGGLSLIGEPLRAAVEAALSKYVMRAFAPGPKVALARLGEDVVPVGALALAAGAN